MLKVGKENIPFFVSEIKYSNYLDFIETEPTPENRYKDIDVLTGVEFSKMKFTGITGKKNAAASLRRRIKEYQPQRIKNFIHNNEFYILPEQKELTILEGILALNFAKEFSKPKYKNKGIFAMRLYLIATMSRKVQNGVPETLPLNLGEVHDFIEERVQELEDISFKIAMDFNTFFFEFEKKMSSGFFQYAFKSIHPINIKKIDREGNERGKRFLSVFGAFSILDHLIAQGIIDATPEGLKTPFFHSLLIYSINVNK